MSDVGYQRPIKSQYTMLLLLVQAVAFKGFKSCTYHFLYRLTRIYYANIESFYLLEGIIAKFLTRPSRHPRFRCKDSSIFGGGGRATSIDPIGLLHYIYIQLCC